MEQFLLKFDELTLAARNLVKHGHIQMAQEVLAVLGQEIGKPINKEILPPGMQPSYTCQNSWGGAVDVTNIVKQYWGDRSKKIDFIKAIRATTNLGLKEAKDWVETIPGF